MWNVVTGGAGFIGSNLICQLLKNNEKVICIDNFITGNINNLNNVIGNKNLKIINQDINEPLNLSDKKIKKIWHLACLASPEKYRKYPILTAKTNSIGTFNIISLANQHNARLLFTSSSEIYGNSKEFPQSESSNSYLNPIGKRSCYVEGKRFAESICFDYIRQRKTNICVARIFNTYGPKMHPNDGRVISNFISNGLINKSINIFGDGLQTRSFCYVEDIVEGLIRLMNSNLRGPINLGNIEEINIVDLGNLINKKLNNKNKIVFLKEREDEQLRRKPDIALAKKLLGWEPCFSLFDGLDITIEYFKKLNLSNS